MLETSLLTRLSNLSEKFYLALTSLENALTDYNGASDSLTKAKYCEGVLLKNMEELRAYADEMELITGKDFSAFPSYEDILYSVKY